MAIVTVIGYLPVCDCCGCEFKDYYKSVEDAKKAVKNSDWTIIGPNGYCPECIRKSAEFVNKNANNLLPEDVDKFIEHNLSSVICEDIDYRKLYEALKNSELPKDILETFKEFAEDNKEIN